MSVAIRCTDLHKQYDAGKRAPVDALRGLELEVQTGECFGLLGPNGAGKTTTVEILEGLLQPTSGTVEVLGMRWGVSDRALRERIGISLQETRLADKLSVRETLRLFRGFYSRGRDPNEAMEAVSLTDKADAWVVKLSGGQRQRLAVACALVGDPELLFLDEPTTGLDPQSRRELWDIIRTQRGRGRTTLITTHYMDEAERLCDRVAVVDYGKVIALGSPRELIARLGGEHIIEFAVNGFDPARVLGPDVFRGVPTANDARLEADGFALTVTQPHVAIPGLLSVLQTERLELARLTTRHVSLEDVFVSLTGRHLSAEELASNPPLPHRRRR